MKRTRVLIFITVAVFMALLSAGTKPAGSADTSARTAPPPATVRMAPDFTLQDLKGKDRSLKDFRGKVVLLNFTTTWCPYCKKDIPNLKKLHASLKGRDFELVSIYVNESPTRVAQFAEKNSLPYTILVDSDAAIARQYGVRGVPMKVVLDRKGEVQCYQCTSAEDTAADLLKKK